MATVSKDVYWQQIIENPSVYGSITTSDAAFNNQAECVWQVMGDSFILRATNWEVSRWENMLGITASGTLTARKVAVLNRMTEQTPCTVRILNQIIKGIAGDDEYYFEYNNNNDTLSIEINARHENKVLGLVSRVIPANLQVKCDFVYTPVGYIEAAFLESTGTQFINTGFKLDNQFVLEVEYTQMAIVQYGSVFGARLTAGRIDTQRDTTTNVVWLYYGAGNKRYTYSAPINSHNKVRLDVPESKIEVNGTVIGATEWATAINQLDLYIFAENFPTGGNATSPPRAAYLEKIRMSRFYFSQEQTYDFIPAISRNGVPCLIDTENKKELKNAGTGDFVVGFTLEQARKLSKLSSQGGTLAISLPANYTDDAEVVAALATAEAKGWVFEKRTYDAGSTASTFALRRILVRQTQDDNGNYVDADGMRYRVEWCEEVLGAEPESLGYEPFRSVEAACEYWGLEPYVYPEWEEDFLTNN